MNLSNRWCLAFSLLLFLLAGQAYAALEIYVGMNPNTARQGELVRVDLTVTNTGGSAESSTVLTASVPTGFDDFRSNTPNMTGGGTCDNTICSPGEVATWTLGTIAPGASTTVSYWTTVDTGGTAPDATVLAVDGTVTWDVSNQANASQSVTVDGDNPLAIEIDQDSDPVQAGARMVYTISYGNRGINSVTGNTLSVPLPSGVTFVDATGSFTETSGTVEWDLGTLVAGKSGRQQIFVDVNAVSAGTLLTVDAASISGTDSGTAAVVTSEAITTARVTASAGLAMTVEVNPDPVRSGELAHNEITVSNQAGEALFNVTLVMRVPPEFTSFRSDTPNMTGGGGCNNTVCDQNELATWNLGTLPPGGSVTVTAWTDMRSLDSGQLSAIDAVVSADGGRQTLATHTVAIDNDTALMVALDENLDPARSGDKLVYTLSYGNRSVSSVQSTTLRLPLPTGVTFFDASGSFTQTGNEISWNLGTLTAGETGRQQVTVTVDSLAAGTLLPIDAATLTGTNQANFQVEEYRATAATKVTASSGIGMTVEVNPDPVRSDEQVHNEITVSNQAGEALFNVTLVMRVQPEFRSFRSDSTNNGNGFLTGGGSCNNSVCDPNEVAIWNLGTLAPGAAVTVTAWTRMQSLDPGQLSTIDAIVTADGGRQTLASHTIAIDNDTSLMFALDENLDPARSGDTLVYTLSYGNRSVSSVTSNTLRLPLPSGVSFVDASGSFTQTGNVIEWNLGTLVAGETGRQQVSVTVDALSAGTLLPIDAATLTGTNQANFQVEEYRATASTKVSALGGIGMTLEVNPDPVGSDEPVTNEIVVSNQAGETLFNVTLVMRIPLEFRSFRSDNTNGANGYVNGGGFCNNSVCDAIEVVTWNLGTLLPGASVQVSAWTAMQSVDSGRLSMVDAIVTADGGRQTLAAHTIGIDNDTALTLSIDSSEDVVLSGEPVQYTLTFGNRSINSVTGATLTFPVPAAATTVNSSGGTLSDGMISWNLGTLAAGEGGRRTVTASIGGSAADLVPVDAAELTATSTGPEVIRATNVTRIEASRPLEVSIEYVVNPTQPDDTMTAMIDVTNTTGSSILDVVLDARVPDFLDNFRDDTGEVSDSGTCNNTVCQARERVNWQIGTLLAGETRSVSYMTTVDGSVSAPVNGELIRLDVEARDSAGADVTASDTALVGPFSDAGDGDGVADLFDNCVNDANSDQRDTDGDGFGNLCDADFNGNGVVDPFDFSLLKSRFGQPGFPDQDLNGNGIVDPFDFSKLKSNFGQAPGPSGLVP